MDAYDLIVIGAGSAGLSVAGRCNEAGWRVAVVDSRPFGGTCALRGCQPKKILTSAAAIIIRSQLMRGKGVSGKSALSWPELVHHKRQFTAPIPESTEKELSASGIDIYHGAARFTDRNMIAVEDKTLSGRYFLISTGAEPVKLNIPGEEHVITSDRFMELEDLLPTVTFIGGGYVSFEFAHVAAAAGANVQILQRGTRPLKKFDPDLVRMLVKHSERLGIEVLTGTEVRAVEESSGRFVVRTEQQGRTFTTDLVVHGAGRVPAVQDLDPGKADISCDSNGVLVNPFMQSVTNSSVYAAGDAAAGGLPLLPVASMEGRLVADNLLNGNVSQAEYDVIPSVAFTFPPIASVGLLEKQAEEQGLEFSVNFQDTSEWPTSWRIGLEHSGSKVLIEKGTERILGAHILGHHAEEVINVFAIAMKMKISPKDLKKVLWSYPTSIGDIDSMC